MNVYEIIFFLILGCLGYVLYKKKKSAQLLYIENYRFNSVIKKKILVKYPHLSDDQVHLVFDALREYFYICNQAKKRMVSMPSQVVDEAWHEFILFTKPYQSFCKKALGRFLHHVPTEAMSTRTLAQDGIKRAWRLSCAKNNINPIVPKQLPLLFGIDAQLNIKNGFKYSIDCKNRSSPFYGDGYCASHIGCSSGCAGMSGSSSDGSGGFFGGSSDSGDSGGCSSGCGGGD